MVRPITQLGLLLLWLVLITCTGLLLAQAAPGIAQASDADAGAVQPIQTLALTDTCPAGMAAYWQLDEASGPVYADAFNINNAQCAGSCPTAVNTGWVNRAQVFSRPVNTGASVPIHPPNIFDWGAAASFSIELWAKGVPGQTCSQTGTANNEVMIGRDDRTLGLHWWLGCKNGTGQAVFQLGSGTSGSPVALEGPVITDGTWHHLVGVRDGGSNTNRLYVDGVEVDSAFRVYTTSFTSPTAALNIGWLDTPSSRDYRYNGTLDELAVYNRVLNPAEVTAHYNGKNPGPGYCGGDYAPRFTSAPVTSVNIEELYTYDVNTSGQPSPTYSLTTAPAGMTIDATTGVILWTPSILQNASYNVVVQALNTAGVQDQSFIVTVIDKYYAPHITSIPVIVAKPEEPYTYTVTADSDPAPVYSLLNAPAGMTINSTTGAISWTPITIQVGLHNITIQAENVRGTDTQAFTLLVTPLPPVYLPVVQR